jgi:hypothetical protein
MRIDDHIKSYLDGCTAADAINLLCEEFGKGRTVVTFIKSGQRRELQSLAEASHLHSLAPEDLGPIEFYGGPPNNKKYYCGTLLTMLCDAVLYNHAMYGHYEEMVLGSEHETQKNETGLYSDGIPF